ncbi:MAG: hypothetical protein HYY57_05095 [Candidatus Omnitrophica bacterium]|nr:hypothetical protein [Candidatus Omnitrophota bacterium]
MKIGVIDVGTHSTHLLIGTLDKKGRFHQILARHDATELGQNGLSQNQLTPVAMRRTLGILKEYAKVLCYHKPDRIEAVATSALRDARNGNAFARQVRKKTGLALRVIPGEEEARLIYRGVFRTIRFRGSALIIAIGAGSAQIILGQNARPLYAGSFPLGASRLAQRFIRQDPAAANELEALDRFVRRSLAPVFRILRGRQWEKAFGSSAAIYQLMKAVGHFNPARHPARKLAVTQEALRSFIDWASLSTAKQLRCLPGVEPRWQGLLLPAAVTLSIWMNRCGISTLHFAPGSLREGLIGLYQNRSPT